MARDDIAEAVEAFDRRIATPEPTAYSSPVQVGTIEKAPSQAMDRKIMYRYHGLGGDDILVLVPARVDCAATDHDVHELIARLCARMEPGGP
jgi:hypothetical protein